MSNSKLPWFRTYAADWVTDERVMDLSDAQQGLYFRILCYMWLSGTESVPQNVRKMSKLCHSTPKKIQKLLHALGHPNGPFSVENDRIVSNRLRIESTERQEVRDARRDAGKRGAESRWGDKEGGICHPVATDLPLANNGDQNRTEQNRTEQIRSEPDKPAIGILMSGLETDMPKLGKYVLTVKRFAAVQRVLDHPDLGEEAIRKAGANILADQWRVEHGQATWTYLLNADNAEERVAEWKDKTAAPGAPPGTVIVDGRVEGTIEERYRLDDEMMRQADADDESGDPRPMKVIYAEREAKRQKAMAERRKKRAASATGGATMSKPRRQARVAPRTGPTEAELEQEADRKRQIREMAETAKRAANES